MIVHYVLHIVLLYILSSRRGSISCTLKNVKGELLLFRATQILLLALVEFALYYQWGMSLSLVMLYSPPQSKQNLLSFKDICFNGFHVKTETAGG